MSSTPSLRVVGRAIDTSPRRGRVDGDELDHLVRNLSVSGDGGPQDTAKQPDPNAGRISGPKVAYFLLLFVRLACAVLPGYLHPDEHFQSVEIIAGTVLDGLYEIYSCD